jgi:hypothetical protein
MGDRGGYALLINECNGDQRHNIFQSSGIFFENLLISLHKRYVTSFMFKMHSNSNRVGQFYNEDKRRLLGIKTLSHTPLEI